MAENEKNVDIEVEGEKPAAKKRSQKKNKYQEEIAALKIAPIMQRALSLQLKCFQRQFRISEWLR